MVGSFVMEFTAKLYQAAWRPVPCPVASPPRAPRDFRETAQWHLPDFRSGEGRPPEKLMTPCLFSISYAGLWGQCELSHVEFIEHTGRLGYLAGSPPRPDRVS
jgi:hypothetical protein